MPRLARILIVRLSAIGDVINTLPAFLALRAALPGAHLGWVVEDRAAGILEGLPGLDRLHRFPRASWSRRWRTSPLEVAAEACSYAAGIRGVGYDTVLDFQGNAKSALHVVLSGARHRWGFVSDHSREGSHVVTNHRVRPRGEVINRVEKNLSLVAALGVPVPARPMLLPVAEDVHARTSAWLAGAGLAGGFAVLHPGTSRFGAFKRWPLHFWAEAGRRLHADSGLPVLVTWGPGERWMARAIVAGMGEGAVEAPPISGLRFLAGVLSRARVVAGCDSAALHLAARVGTPTVGLFGPKDPRVYAPYGNSGVVLRGEVACSPCTRRTCAFPECMHRIEPMRLAEALGRVANSCGNP